MKRNFLTICLALIAFVSIKAESFTGDIVVTFNGEDYQTVVTVNITPNDNGLYDMELIVPDMLTVNMYDVPAAQNGDVTVYSAVRDVETPYGAMRTTLFARSVDGMAAANLAIEQYGVTMWFNTVGDHFQLPNSNFEAWAANTGEPDRWHGFESASGTYASTSAGLASLEQSEDVREGVEGHSAVMTAGSLFGIVANGTMTNGRLNAGSMSATSTSNNASMDNSSTSTDANGDLFYMPLYAKPDKFNVWLKYTQGTINAENKANVSVKTFDGTYYQEPVNKTYTNLSGSIVGGQVPAGDWTQYSFPFDYDSYAANNAASEAIFVTFSTNGNPGQGSKNDALYVDDIELVYLADMTDLRYKGVTIDGWDPAVTDYDMQFASVPDLDDFTADVTGASAVVTKSIEQNEDGTYRIAISAVPGDLLNATCYVITASVASVKRGDVNNDGTVNISDVTTLIDYLLSGNSEGINLQAADVDENTAINISDVTSLIDMLLSGSAN